METLCHSYFRATSNSIHSFGTIFALLTSGPVKVWRQTPR